MTSPLFALLAGAIDYAGLFPPAALPMAEAVANYRAYRRSPDRWALGRFVVPIARLAEFEAVAAGEDFPISAIGGEDPEADAKAVVAFNLRHPKPGLVIEAIEAPARTAEEAARRIAVSVGLECYCETPPGSDLLRAIGAQGGRAKIRTGGAEAVPSAAALAGFMERCAALALPFKATAGLHQAFAGSRDGARMHGFMPVALAAALLASAAAADRERALAEARALLEAEGAGDFRVGAAGIQWRGLEWTPARVAAGRALYTAFGSCSFEEPMGELRGMGLLGR